jgi:hypothetical protein
MQSPCSTYTLRLSFRAPPLFPIRKVRKPPAVVALATIKTSTTSDEVGNKPAEDGDCSYLRCHFVIRFAWWPAAASNTRT